MFTKHVWAQQKSTVWYLHPKVNIRPLVDDIVTHQKKRTPGARTQPPSIPTTGRTGMHPLTGCRHFHQRREMEILVLPGSINSGQPPTSPDPLLFGRSLLNLSDNCLSLKCAHRTFTPRVCILFCHSRQLANRSQPEPTHGWRFGRYVVYVPRLCSGSPHHPGSAETDRRPCSCFDDVMSRK